MAKICPLTGEPVLYLTCNECEDKAKCRKLSNNKIKNNNNSADNLEKEKSVSKIHK
jgi:hypothetical protein